MTSISSTACIYCGNVAKISATLPNGNNNHARKELSAESWWCFSAWCGKSRIKVQEESNSVMSFPPVETFNDRYIRRRTIQFENDLTITTAAHRKSVAKAARNSTLQRPSLAYSSVVRIKSDHLIIDETKGQLINKTVGTYVPVLVDRDTEVKTEPGASIVEEAGEEEEEPPEKSAQKPVEEPLEDSLQKKEKPPEEEKEPRRTPGSPPPEPRKKAKRKGTKTSSSRAKPLKSQVPRPIPRTRDVATSIDVTFEKPKRRSGKHACPHKSHHTPGSYPVEPPTSEREKDRTRERERDKERETERPKDRERGHEPRKVIRRSILSQLGPENREVVSIPPSGADSVEVETKDRGVGQDQPKRRQDYHQKPVEQQKIRKRGSSESKAMSDDTFILGPAQKPLQDDKCGVLVPVSRGLHKLLLVFAQFDNIAETLTKAAEKTGFEVSQSYTVEMALGEFQNCVHDLVMIDCRQLKALDPESLSRSVRLMRNNQHTAVIAIVKKSVYEKDDTTIPNLLNAGFNRCIIETGNCMVAMNELLQLKQGDMDQLSTHATSKALYRALNICRDMVVITDDSYRCQYANKSCEKLLGFKQEELVNKSISDTLAHDPIQVSTIGSSLLRGKEWNGPFSLKRKNQDAINSTCRAYPVACTGRLPSHFVYVFDTGPNMESALAQPRGSVHSLRRGSNDVRSVGSDFLRRTSLAKLNALPLEAPISKIISILEQARDNSLNNPNVIALLDKAEDFLRCPELYVAYVKEDYKMKTEEGVVSDLISALLSKQPQPNLPPSSRRSSNDSSIMRTSKINVMKLAPQMRDLLETSLQWEFEIFRLEDMSKKHPLQYLGMNLFTHFDVANVLNVDEKILFNWLTIIEANYHPENSYHNCTHAADVMQGTACFLEKEKLKSIMDPLDEATSLVAAAAHDVDHPGKSSAFLCNSDNHLAILYNDVTVLENHHAALMFKLTLGDDRVNIFKNLDKDTYKTARHNVIDMILATEMTKHFEHLAKFVNVFCTKASGSDTDIDSQDYIPLALPENITLIKRMMIKCSDVSNPARPLKLCVEWARRIAEEYFQQTDEEKAKGLPVVMPMFDRATCSIPKSQIGFVDYIINDMFEAWNAFIDMPELITFMRQNYIRWKELDEQGHTTLADIRKLQSSVLLSPVFSATGSGKRAD